MTQQFYFWVRTKKELKAGSQTDTYTVTFIAALSMTAKMWSNRSIYQAMNRSPNVVYTNNGIFSGLKNAETSDKCYNMDET